MKRSRVGRLGFTMLFFVTLYFTPELNGIVVASAAADYESLMREAVALRRSGDDAAALKLFQQAYELNKTPRGLAQIGMAEQALGRWSASDKHLRQALESSEDPWIRKNRATIDAALLLVAAHVGQLDVSGTPVGAEVRIDGEWVGRLPLRRPIAVTAGGVAVEVRATGYLPIVRAATVGARTLTREIFNLQPLAPVASQGAAGEPGSTAKISTPPDAVEIATLPSNGPRRAGNGGDAIPGDVSTRSSDPSPGPSSGPSSGHPRGGSGRRALVWVAGGLAAASLAFGIIEHLSWQDKVSSFGSMSACGITFPNDGGPGCRAIYEDGLRARNLAFVGYGLTTAFAATALILHFTDPDSGSAPRNVACAPISVTAGVGCTLRF